jgi:hypothetical protein
MVSKQKGLGGPFNNQNTTNGLGSWRSAMAPVGPLEVGGHLSHSHLTLPTLGPFIKGTNLPLS